MVAPYSVASNCSSRVLRAPRRQPSLSSVCPGDDDEKSQNEALPVVQLPEGRLDGSSSSALSNNDIMPSHSRNSKSSRRRPSLSPDDKVERHVKDSDDHGSDVQLQDSDPSSTSSSSGDDDEEEGSDCDDDATYVTSNQKSVASNPRSVTFSLRHLDTDEWHEESIKPPGRSNGGTNGVNSIKEERWSTGDGPSIQSATSKQSSRRSKTSRRRRSNPTGIPHDICDDLKSKPGMIAFEKVEEEEDFEEEATQMDTSLGNSRGGQSKLTHSSSSSSASMTLTEERVRAHMVDYYEDYDTIFRQANLNGEHWDAFFRQYFTEDVVWIRSTGNPLDREGLKKLMVEDITGIKMAIVSIDSIQLLAGGKAAVVVFTADQVYLYKGKHESDRTVLTSVLHVVNGCEILIGHEHRCIGKPIPEGTRWD